MRMVFRFMSPPCCDAGQSALLVVILSVVESVEEWWEEGTGEVGRERRETIGGYESQMAIVRSWMERTTGRPAGVKATAFMGEMPRGIVVSLREARSQILDSVSAVNGFVERPVVARRFPSGERRTAPTGRG
jgi:hypothetical protein